MLRKPLHLTRHQGLVKGLGWGSRTMKPTTKASAPATVPNLFNRDKPAGNIRITAAEHSARTVLWPKLATFLPDYPDIKIEILGQLRLRRPGRRAFRCRRAPPATPHALASHDCINLRLATHGGLYAWEFEKQGHTLNVKVEGQLVFNGSPAMLQAALDGFGLACVPEDMTHEHVAAGRLVRVLEDWSPIVPTYPLSERGRQ